MVWCCMMAIACVCVCVCVCYLDVLVWFVCDLMCAVVWLFVGGVVVVVAFCCCVCCFVRYRMRCGLMCGYDCVCLF